MSEIVAIPNTSYYAERRWDDRQFVTIIGELSSGGDGVRQKLSVRASKGRASGVWSDPGINWPALGVQSVEVTKDFIALLNFAVEEAERIKAELEAKGITVVEEQ